MYTGQEALINKGEYLPYTMLDFWQYSLSDLQLNMNRGSVAEWIVKVALDRGGCHQSGIKSGIEPYDLDGPPIPQADNARARVEVKSAAYIQKWGPTKKVSFGIPPAIMPDETGGYAEGAEKQRNNDIYVFALYTARDLNRNILDLTWWEFFVLPTYEIDINPKLAERKTLSLDLVRSMCDSLTFDDLYYRIVEECERIPDAETIARMKQDNEDVLKKHVTSWNADTFRSGLQLRGLGNMIAVAEDLKTYAESIGLDCFYGKGLGPCFRAKLAVDFFSVYTFADNFGGYYCTVSIPVKYIADALGPDWPMDKIRDMMTALPERDALIASQRISNTPCYIYMNLRALANEKGMAAFKESLTTLARAVRRAKGIGIMHNEQLEGITPPPQNLPIRQND